MRPPAPSVCLRSAPRGQDPVAGRVSSLLPFRRLGVPLGVARLVPDPSGSTGFFSPRSPLRPGSPHCPHGALGSPCSPLSLFSPGWPEASLGQVGPGGSHTSRTPRNVHGTRKSRRTHGSWGAWGPSRSWGPVAAGLSESVGQKRVLSLGDPGAGWSNRIWGPGGPGGQEGLGALEASSFQGYPQLRPDQGFLGARS